MTWVRLCPMSNNPPSVCLLAVEEQGELGYGVRSWNSTEQICSRFASYANGSTVTNPAVKALFGFIRLYSYCIRLYSCRFCSNCLL